MKYLLDTNIFIAALKGVGSVQKKLEITPLSDIVLSPVVLGELLLGVEKSLFKQKNAERLAKVTERIELVAIDKNVSQQYSVIRAYLEKKGQTIGANDYWIAAQGLALNAVLVTDNTREFKRVPGLSVENWLEKSNFENNS